MYGEFDVGGQYPREADLERLARYDQARRLFEGEHEKSKEAKRIRDKFAASLRFVEWSGYSAEGVVWLTFNLPRLIVTKFADLQVLNTPRVLTEDEEFLDDLKADIPDLWARLHYAMQLERALGDVGLSLTRDEGEGPIGLRVVDPAYWYPVLDDADHQNVLAHQVAWVEDHVVGKKNVHYLRVDVCYGDRMERRAFELEPTKMEGQSSHDIVDRVPLALHWGNLPEVVSVDTGGLSTFVHLSNGWLRPDTIFGRPEFLDSASLIDDINWRLASWSDANDRVSHAPEIIPKEWLSQDEDGTVRSPSQYRRRYVAQGSRVVDSGEPRYMQYPLSFDTLKEQYEASVRALLVRHEMAPALLGIETGRERESGEAKSLGMGTTEAATRRHLLQTQPRIDQALTVLARLKGHRNAEVSTHWRVGLPKTQAELMQEMQTKRSLGLMTREDMLRQLYPYMTDEQIAAKLVELEAERSAEMALFTDSTAEQG